MELDELKSLVGEAAFKAMSQEQANALVAKFKTATPPPPKKDDAPPPPPKEDDDSLFDKTKKAQAAADDKKNESHRLESAIKFNLSSAEWLKNNKDLLPSDVEDLFRNADKEKYDSHVERANAMRSALIQSFFSVQSNMDYLTANQKRAVDDYFKLTKNGRESKAEQVFEDYFEPALELIKRVKKAEEVGRARQGFATGSKAEDLYKEKLIQGSRKTYLGEK